MCPWSHITHHVDLIVNGVYNNILFSSGRMWAMNLQMQRLYQAAQELKKTVGQSAVARLLGVTPQTIYNWEQRGISRQGMIDAQRIIGCSAAWLETGQGQQLVESGFPVKNMISAAAEQLAGVRVDLLANSASMGLGTDVHDTDALCGHITLTDSFARNQIKPSRPEALRFIHAYGDSMEPTFSSGDVLLVDTGVGDVKIDGVYVLRAHDRLFIKRVRQRMDGHFEISSDNPTHRTVDVLNGDHEVAVVGRVLWAWNGRKL